LLDQKSGNDPVDDLQDRGEELGMCSEQKAKRDRKREHPLSHRHRWSFPQVLWIFEWGGRGVKKVRGEEF
jgi:hypothetical protein